jgi:hypothetical protein
MRARDIHPSEMGHPPSVIFSKYGGLFRARQGLTGAIRVWLTVCGQIVDRHVQSKGWLVEVLLWLLCECRGHTHSSSVEATHTPSQPSSSLKSQILPRRTSDTTSLCGNHGAVSRGDKVLKPAHLADQHFEIRGIRNRRHARSLSIPVIYYCQSRRSDLAE